MTGWQVNEKPSTSPMVVPALAARNQESSHIGGSEGSRRRRRMATSTARHDSPSERRASPQADRSPEPARCPASPEEGCPRCELRQLSVAVPTLRATGGSDDALLLREERSVGTVITRSTTLLRLGDACPPRRAGLISGFTRAAVAPWLPRGGTIPVNACCYCANDCHTT